MTAAFESIPVLLVQELPEEFMRAAKIKNLKLANRIYHVNEFKNKSFFQHLEDIGIDIQNEKYIGFVHD